MSSPEPGTDTESLRTQRRPSQRRPAQRRRSPSSSSSSSEDTDAPVHDDPIESDDEVLPPRLVSLNVPSTGRRSHQDVQVSPRTETLYNDHIAKPARPVKFDQLKDDYDQYRDAPRAFVRRLNEKRKLDLEDQKIEPGDRRLFLRNTYYLDAVCITGHPGKGFDIILPEDLGQTWVQVNIEPNLSHLPLRNKHFDFGFDITGRTYYVGSQGSLKLWIVWKPNGPDVDVPRAPTTALLTENRCQFALFWANVLLPAAKGLVTAFSRDTRVKTPDALWFESNIL